MNPEFLPADATARLFMAAPGVGAISAPLTFCCSPSSTPSLPGYPHLGGRAAIHADAGGLRMLVLPLVAIAIVSGDVLIFGVGAWGFVRRLFHLGSSREQQEDY